MATIQLSANNVSEHPEVGTVIGTLSVEGGKNNETFTFTLTDSLDERFEIKLNETTGLYELVVKTADGDLFDFDSGLKSFDISITAVSNAPGDPTDVTPADFTVNVVDNVAPTDIALSNVSIVEKAVAGTEVGTLSAIDPNLDDSFTFTLTNDAEGRFEIVAGKLVVKDGSKLDYLTASSHQIDVEVTDADGNTFEKTLTINVTDAFDFLTGNSKNNTIVGNKGAEVIKGLAGNDRLYGMGGDDVLNGGSGKDYLVGGAGKDTFVFDSPVKKGHFDHIADFVSADDTIQISLSALKAFKVKGPKKNDLISKKASDTKKSVGFDKIFKKGHKLEKKFFDIGTKDNDADGTNDYVYYNKKNGKVYLDVDGSGKQKGIEILKLKPGTALSADDFLFI